MLKFLIKILAFTSFFANSNGFILQNTNNVIKKPRFLEYNKINTKINMFNQECPEYLSIYKNILTQQQNEYLIKQISSSFPHMDSISHYVLHTNEVMINTILNNSHLNTEIKKILVLLLVEFTQFGDASGGVILQFYHDLVNCLL